MTTVAQYRGPRFGAIDRFLVGLIRDERDLPFLHYAILSSVTVVPLGIALFVAGSFPWWVSVAYWAFTVAFMMPPFVLLLHNVCHRKLFKREYGFLSHYIPWVLGPFYGQTPDTYYAHHIGMHHVEGNLADDLSTTMPYRRDRVSHFLHYFGSFFFGGLIELGGYLRRRNRKRLLRKMVTGELAFYALVAVLMFVSWQATVTVFVVPFVLCRFAMMAGNWGQHAFVDARDPADSYLNSITCIDCSYNKRCFNDGYHIGHHIKPDRHWTEMPEDFERNRSKYAEAGAIVFRGIDFFGVWCCLMLRRYDWLADRYVELDGRGRSRDEIAAMLRARTQPVPFPKPATR